VLDFIPIYLFRVDKWPFLSDIMNNEYAKHLHKRANRKAKGDGCEVEPCSLASAESYVRTSASGTGNGRSKEFATAFTCLLEWAEDHALIHSPADFSFLGRSPEDFQTVPGSVMALL
jgi:hypothetical protein